MSNIVLYALLGSIAATSFLTARYTVLIHSLLSRESYDTTKFRHVLFLKLDGRKVTGNE